jgi:hypothetical protein
MNGSLLIFDYRVDIINKESSFLYKENKLKLAYLQGHGTGLLTLTGERNTSENSKVCSGPKSVFEVEILMS